MESRCKGRVQAFVPKWSFLVRKRTGDVLSLHPVRKVDSIVELVNPRSILEIGCGIGKTTVYLHLRGFEADGIEASSLAILKSDVPTSFVSTIYETRWISRNRLIWCGALKWPNIYIRSL
jgi:hypothetical protein